LNNWRRLYQNKIVSAERAVQNIKSGDRVVTGHACGEPQVLIEALVARSPEIKDVEIVHMVAMGPAKYAQPGLEKSFRHNALFVGGTTRKAVEEKRADFTPCFFSEIPRLFKNNILPVDVALIQVTPPDEQGFCSYGVSVDYTKTAAECARIVIAQMNPCLPRTGGAKIHLDAIHFIVEQEEPLIELKPPKIGDVEKAIGENVAKIIPDGANSALQVDLMGEVNAEMIGPKQFSAVGGQVDFIRGASRSLQGKSIIALPSTASGGTISRIACELDRGAAVTTSRNDVHYVVTEYGMADLRGKSLSERAKSLIAISHPDFRDSLTKEAKEKGLM